MPATCSPVSSRADDATRQTEKIDVVLLLGLFDARCQRLRRGTQQLEVGQLCPSGRFLDAWMERPQINLIHHHLLRLQREQVAGIEPRGIGMWCVFRCRGGTGDQRRALQWIDRVDRVSLVLVIEKHVFAAVHSDWPLALRDHLRRFCRGLHLHHLLPGQFLEEAPSDGLDEDIGGDGDDPAVVGAGLHQLSNPFRSQ